jgi:SAM-dependent methyltransferase
MSITAKTDLWNQDASYHEMRAPHSKSQVASILMPNLLRHVPKATPLTVVDFACGGGTVAAEFAEQATEAGYEIERFVLVDVVQDNLDAAVATLRKKLPANKVTAYLCNGSDFSDYKGPKGNYFYCWDAMVHFDLLDIIGYIATLKCIAKDVAFFHHSNLDKVTTNIHLNPHHRNYMTKNLFHQITVSNGFAMLEQWTLDWGGLDALDCRSTMRIA